MILALFDFDGTITHGDSFLGFIRFAVGTARYAFGMAALTPAILDFALKRISNDRLKELALQRFFAGWSEAVFRETAADYSRRRLPLLVKASALQRIRWHQQQQHQVVVVSASAEDWLQEWCKQQGVALIGTKLEIADGKLTGKIAGLNCYGPEKVRRVKMQYDLSDATYIYAYGDSKGDREMLELANEKYFRYFH